METWIRRLSIAISVVFLAAIPYIATRAYVERYFELAEPSPKSSAFTVLEATSTIPADPEQEIKRTLKILSLIAECESNNIPTAANPSSSAKGLLQIIDGTWSSFGCAGNVYNSKDNMSCGLKIATQSGLHHWNESKSCWIKLVNNG